MNTIQNSISIDGQYKAADTVKSSQPASPSTGNSVAQAAASIPTANTGTNILSQKNAVPTVPVSSSNSKTTSSPSSADKESQKAMDFLNKKLAELNNNHMLFKKDNATGLNVYTLMDISTNKVIKQYPSEDFLYVAKRLTEYLDKVNSQTSLGNNVGTFISESA